MSYLPLAFLWWRFFSGVSGSRECEVHRGHAFGYLGQKNGVQELVPIAMVAAMDGAQCVDALRQLCSGASNQCKMGKGPGHDAPPTLFVLFIAHISSSHAISTCAGS